MALVGDDLTDEMAGVFGLQIDVDTKAKANEVATKLVRLKQRVVFMFVYEHTGRLVFCEAYKLGYRHAIMMNEWF